MKKNVTKNATADEDDEVLTPKEVAARWKMSKRFVDHARENYGLPFFRLGRTIRFRKSEVDSWFEQRKTVA